MEKSGVPVAGIVSSRDLEWLQERDRDLAELRETMDEMRQVFCDVPLEEFNHEVERAVQDSRAHSDGRPCMIRIVLDTNALVSSVRAGRGPSAVIREDWLSGRFQVYVSEPLLTEVVHPHNTILC